MVYLVAPLQPVAQALKRTPDLNLVLIDSKAISGWNPESERWPTFSQNVGSFMRAVGPKGHHLTARSAAEISQRFEEVAAMIDDEGMAK